MSTFTPQPSFDFDRAYGVRHVPMSGEDFVTTISRPDWFSFRDSLDNVISSGKAGDFILGPELITSTDITLGEIAVQRTVIEERVHEAKLLTLQCPDTTLLLGTAVFDVIGARPRNAVLFLQDGEELGRTHKSYTEARAEQEFFYHSQMPNVRKPAPHVGSVISADIIDPPTATNNAHTLLISSCWGMPLGYPSQTPSTDPRLKDNLTLFTRQLFENNPQLETVVMADRVPAASEAIAPFNFVATRTEA